MEQSSHPYPAEPLRILHLKGTEREIGRQHAEQVGSSAQNGMVKFYSDFWKRMLCVEGGGLITNSALSIGKRLLDSLLVDRLVAQVPDWAKERLQGCAEISGFPPDEIVRVLVLPDLLPILQAYLTKLRPKTFIEVSAPPRFGCTSFISLGRQFLHGRNLDFPGVAYWDRYPVIQVMQKPGALRVIAFTTAGVPIGGITGINEAQISLSLHQHYCAETNIKGTLPFIIGEQILFEARTLQDAINILQKARVASSWAFVVTDGKTRRGFIYESHPRASGITHLTPENPVLTHSNFFQTAECRPAEYSTSSRMNWDNYWRKTRLHELVSSSRGELSLQDATQFISDHYDRYWEEEKPFNRTVSQVYNIQSIVLDSASMKVLIAEGNAPIHLGQYREYDLAEMLRGKDGATGTIYSGYRFRSASKRQAKEYYILSFISAFEGRNTEALQWLNQSLAAEFTSEGAIVAAVLNLKEGEYTKSADLLEAAKSNMETRIKNLGKKTPPPEFFEAELYLARTYDLLGQRSRAIKLYQHIASHPHLEDMNLRRIAGLEGPYSPAHLRKILMPYSSYIPFL